jgi:glyoxylase-like metal-dependent hydrolase (beta-lactamase superfamily II)
MAIDYDIVVQGNSLRLPEGFIGLANLSLIRAPAGPLLFDVGHAPNRNGLIDGLARHGLAPAEVPRVLLSHLHVDHVMNIDLFPRVDWEYARAPHLADQFVPWLIHEQLEKYDLRLLDDEGEIEPGLTWFRAPGHTPGCTALAFESPAKGRVVIAGDAIKFPRELLTEAVDLVFDSQANASASIRRIKAMADRIVPGHFAEFARAGGGWVWEDVAAVTLLIR